MYHDQLVEICYPTKTLKDFRAFNSHPPPSLDSFQISYQWPTCDVKLSATTAVCWTSAFFFAIERTTPFEGRPQMDCAHQVSVHEKSIWVIIIRLKYRSV